MKMMRLSQEAYDALVARSKLHKKPKNTPSKPVESPTENAGEKDGQFREGQGATPTSPEFNLPPVPKRR